MSPGATLKPADTPLPARPRGPIVTRSTADDTPPPDHAGFEELRRLGLEGIRLHLERRRKHK